MNGQFQKVVTACQNLRTNSSLKFDFSQSDRYFAVMSVSRDLSLKFRNLNGTYANAVFETKVAWPFEAVTTIIDASLSAYNEPTLCYCIDGMAPSLNGCLTTLLNTGAAFFIVVNGQKADIPSTVCEHLPVILVEITPI